MMVIRGSIFCERWSRVNSRLTCTLDSVEFDFDPSKDDEIERTTDLAIAAGYITNADRSLFYCPRHDPAAAGTTHQVTGEYEEVAPGVLVRSVAWGCWPIEVKTEPPPKPKSWTLDVKGYGHYKQRLVLSAVYDDEDVERAHELFLRALGTSTEHGVRAADFADQESEPAE